MVYTRLASLSVLAVVCAAAQAAPVLTKAPDLGANWHPLSSSGTYVYANSFVLSSSTSVDSIGFWLQGGSSEVKFQIWGDNLNRPDAGNVLTSSVVSSGNYLDLTLVTLPVTAVNLVAGQTYWVAATTVGLGGSGSYTFGGHTQNSGGIVDNGTFWYSNDPTGVNFDGRGYTPEIAFQLGNGGISSVPAPGAVAVMALNALAVVRRRRKA